MSAPQFSADGHWWWNGQQWVPAVEARAQAEEVARFGGTLPAYLPPVEVVTEPAHRRLRLPALGAVLAALLAVAITSAVRGGGTGTANAADDVAPVEKSLLSATQAQASRFARHGAYSDDMGQLVDAGFRAQRGVKVTVVRADKRSYCLEGHKGGTVRYATALGVSEHPCS